jgi:NAD(P)-dependent dehydrogenase (short-subunit alcohol dehydrogenase family)
MDGPAGKSELMTGKVVVITGGASGIGRAAALAFSRERATVVIGDIDIAAGPSTPLQRAEKWAGRQTVCESVWPNRLTCTLWSGSTRSVRWLGLCLQ